MKVFNTTAVCIPEKHYMVDISERVKEFKKLIDLGEYFTINRARQYGKTTTITALKNEIAGIYVTISLDFQGISKGGFASEEEFVQEFSRLILKKKKTISPIPKDIENRMEGFVNQDIPKVKLGELFSTLYEWCGLSDQGIVLIIDEVDSAANNQVFLDFLAQLREGYISRETDHLPAFQSVILAGVTDVKHLRSKIREEDQHKVNSPWNIATDFTIDMSLSEDGIRGMLDEYEADHHTGMDTAEIAKQIRAYTNGYPFLVSRICQLIDTQLVPVAVSNLTEAWTDYGVDEAVKRILSEDNTFFDSVMGKLLNYPELNRQLWRILMRGETIAYVPDDEEQKQLRMYGFIVDRHNTVAIANRIFEMRLYAYYIGTSEKNEELKQSAAENRSIFVDEGGWLNVPKIMEHFIFEQNRIHGEQTERFAENEGRERFLTYLSAIINGTGTYSIEEQTRNHKRMDVVIHYLGRRYVIELKIWRGERYHAQGEEQIREYLDYFGLDTGYLLSFNFNQKKEQGVKRVQIGDKVLFEGIV